MASTERARRAAGLDGLRGLAALGVFLVHIWIYTSASRPPRDDWWDLLIWEVRVVVVFFFVLSGFLLFRDFARAVVRPGGPADWRGYGLRRIARIVPAYYVALIGAVALLWGSGAQGFRPIDLSELGLFALFSQNYSLDSLSRFNPVLWTLGLEVAFYIALPLLGLLAYRLGNVRRVSVMLASLIVVGVAWHALVHFLGWGRVASYALPGYLPYFALGMMLSLALEHRVAHHGRRPEAGPALTAALVLGGFALIGLNGYWHAASSEPASDAAIAVFHDLPAGFGWAAVIGAAAFGAGAAVNWTRLRPFAYVGEISYGFYLWHVPLILFANRLDLLPSNFFVAAVVTLPVALVVAAASWHLMEKPVLDRAARRARERAAAGRRAELEAHAAP